MREHKAESAKIDEESAYHMMSHCFRCAVCKKYINRNKRKLVMGVFTWKTQTVCPICFAALGLEVTSRIGA